jgi:dTDP-4-amino-4,6-dideoxygalactose transaminase
MTEQISAEVVSLPMYPELTNEEVQIVIDAVRDFFEV